MLYEVNTVTYKIEAHAFSPEQDSLVARDRAIRGKVLIDLGRKMHTTDKATMAVTYNDLTAADIAAVDADLVKSRAKYVGLNYNGTTVPIANEDAMAMLQVKTAFELGATDTNIHFSNGTVMPINSTDFPAFATWFVTQRNSLFV